MNNIEVKNVHKAYELKSQNEIVLSDLNMTVPSGSIYCLLGSSGCGKTTLISCILGILSLDSGTVKVLQEKVNHKKALRCVNSIGYMPQETALSPFMTVRETLVFFANISQMDMKLFKRQYDMIKSIFKLPPDETFIENISAGEKRRVSLAVAMIHNPKLLILDEPTVELDVIIRQKIWLFMRKLVKLNKNLSILMTTHYIHEAEKADICGFMRNGKMLVEKPPKVILQNLAVEDLDKAFLLLCRQNIEFDDSRAETTVQFQFPDMNQDKRRKTFEFQTLKALSVKKFLWIKRSKM